jgi:hypothetical protein
LLVAIVAPISRVVAATIDLWRIAFTYQVHGTEPGNHPESPECSR